jgi:single-stranded-DNA-specific exonuclease
VASTRRSSSTSSKAKRSGAPARALPAPTASEAAFEALLARFDELDESEPAAQQRPRAIHAPLEAAHGSGAPHDPAHGSGTPHDPAHGSGTPPATVAARRAARLPAAAVPRVSSGLEPADASERADTAPKDTAPTDAERLDALFAKKDRYLERDRYATIGEAAEFFTKVVGVSFEGRQSTIAGLSAGAPLELVRARDNPHDPNAVEVRFGLLHVGFLRREIARRIAPNIDRGERYTASVGGVTGGGEKNVGLNIHVRRHRPVGQRPRPDAVRAPGDADALRIALIGERPIRESQAAVLERVDAGRNTLAVLGTGRGKSFCFQLPAAERALHEGRKTLVFYPLRALANDQYAALLRRLERFGLRILRANGAIDGDERAALEEALSDGAWDVILATPEFASYHRETFTRACNRPDLIVVDEAHHVHESRHRAAYAELGRLIAELGAPQVLALTATARDEAFAEIRRTLKIESWVIDPTVRENLHVVDARNTKDKFAYLARELAGEGSMPSSLRCGRVATAGKAIVYCNSRAEVTKLADRLRAALGGEVAFYHAGIPSDERAAVEDLFRRGAARVVIATSAFGEGIDLPDVRDVVLYHLNFDLTEFNQMAGRAGRDGLDARIHLLYGEADRRINDFIIARSAPSLAVLRELYRGMRELAADQMLRLTYEDVARTLEIEMADASTVAAAVRIFEEGGLVAAGIDDDGRFVRFLEVAGKVDLTKTARFAEGQAEREAFERYCGLALAADVASLESIVNRPIYPDRVPLVV